MGRTRTRTPDLAALLPSWLIHLQAEHKSPQTIRLYRVGARQFIDWCAERDRPAVLDRPTVTAFVASVMEHGEPATGRARLMALRQFSKWLAAEGEIREDLIATVKPPKQDTKIVNSLGDDELRRLLKACQGPTLRDRRDEAIIRLMVETGCRSHELLALTTEDVDLLRGTVTIRRGKGGKGRTVPVGPQTVRALDRYLRLRRQHRRGDSAWLWLGHGDGALAHAGLAFMFKRRAEEAGIGHVHPHMLRHTFASRWLGAGGTESGLMSVAGWSRRDMIDRYSASNRERLAAEEARRLKLGDL